MFQSPTNRVNTSNNLPRTVSYRRPPTCFNPLQIGSTLQTPDMKQELKGPCSGVSIPYKSGQHFKLILLSLLSAKRYSVSIPYKSGQHFKHRLIARITRAFGQTFQSPTNRVNTSNTKLAGRYDFVLTAFQSPTNRVNTSNKWRRLRACRRCAAHRFNPLQIGSTLQTPSCTNFDAETVFPCFNPLQIGSTLQTTTRCSIPTPTIGGLTFQSPTNRVNTSNA